MRSREEIISGLTNPGIIAVVRADSTAEILLACEALIAGGVIAIEITLTTPNALSIIREAANKFFANAIVGAGSVIDAKKCKEAIDAGAEFIVSPITKTEIVGIARAANRAVMLGAFTPAEAQLAHEAGADFVKIFPADVLGPSYIKSILAPLPHLKIIPTGGVDLQNAAEFLKAGCVALGVGSTMVSKKILATKSWPELTRLAREFVAIGRSASKKQSV